MTHTIIQMGLGNKKSMHCARQNYFGVSSTRRRVVVWLSPSLDFTPTANLESQINLKQIFGVWEETRAEALQTERSFLVKNEICQKKDSF